MTFQACHDATSMSNAIKCTSAPEAQGAPAVQALALRGCLPVVQRARQLSGQHKAPKRWRKLHCILRCSE